MKIYLSNYWRKSFIFSIIIIGIIIAASIIFCVWSHDEEDYILIIGCLFYVFLFCYLLFISMKLLRYVVVDKKQYTMYSFLGKKEASVDLESDVYYEVLSLTEGMSSTQYFIILSNLPFTSYSEKLSKPIGLATICKLIDKNGSQIIMPYCNQSTINLFDISAWHPNI